MGTSETEIDDAVILCEQYYESCSRDGFIDETEQHVLSVDAFWIMETEVSYAQFAAFVDANGYGQEAWWTTAGWRWRTENNITEPWHWNNPEWHQPDRPVIGISWYEAMAYAAWLADQTNLDIRLPTEAEWEKAARGTEALRFPWGNEWNGAFLNYCDVNCTNEWREEAYDDGYATTAPVGSYPSGASFYGARDMAGNVWEWIVSQYMPYPYNPADGREDPTGDARRVLRSGSWGVRPIHVRAALRHKSNPDGRYVNAGIRLVLSAAPQ